MSNATLIVKLADGTIRYGIYAGTSDIACPRLFDTSEEAWGSRRSGADMWPDPEPGEIVQAAVIYSTYGGGFWWEGTASHTCIVEGCDPYDEIGAGVCLEVHRGEPEWATKELRDD